MHSLMISATCVSERSPQHWLRSGLQVLLLALALLGAQQIEAAHSHGLDTGMESSQECQLCSTGTLLSAVSGAPAIWSTPVILSTAMPPMVLASDTVITRSYHSRAPPLSSK